MAYYLVAIVAGTTAPALDTRVVQRVAQQQMAFGEPLDDVVVDATSLAVGTSMRLSLQVKRSLTISGAKSNTDFREFIQHSWKTVQKHDFREHVDRVGVATWSVAEETSRAFVAVCEWARASDTPAVFMQRCIDGGSASATHRAVTEAVRMVPLEVGLTQRLLRPILAQPDETAMRMLAPFTVSLVCGEVLDAVLARTLENDALRRSPRNDGHMGGFDLPKLVDSLLFVIVDQAPGSTCFANGVWDGFDQVLPLIDGMVRAAGWHPYVARQFVKLCERSGPAYPTEVFADQLLAQIVDGRLPSGWKGSPVPAAIAALVQAHADRQHPLPATLASKLLRVLDALVDLGDRRSAALQQSESFRGVRLAASA